MALTTKSTVLKSAFGVAIVIAISIVAGLALRTYGLSIYRVQGESMVPTLHDGDLVVVDLWTKTWRNGDVVVFSRPQEAPMIKRIVGLPNSAVYVSDFRVFVNDRPSNHETENHVQWDRNALECRYSDVLAAHADEYLVMGDNRCGSVDSRQFGAVQAKDIYGRVLWKISF